MFFPPASCKDITREIVQRFFRLLLGHTVPFLQFAGKLVALAADDGQIVIGDLAPLLFDFAGELFPITGDLIPIHDEPPSPCLSPYRTTG